MLSAFKSGTPNQKFLLKAVSLQMSQMYLVSSLRVKNVLACCQGPLWTAILVKFESLVPESLLHEGDQASSFETLLLTWITKELKQGQSEAREGLLTGVAH